MSIDPPKAWYSEMTRYHWWILFVASLGWLFDTMDQTLFRLSRQPAMIELVLGKDAVETAEEKATVGLYVGYATAIFLVGWATGGLIFGILGDKWGRARTMLLTIIIYSAFTGLSAFSQGWWDYAIYRFLAGVGVGGEFAAGVALVSETLPAVARARALGLLQALSAVGNIMGAVLSFVLLPMTIDTEWFGPLTGWRLAMIAGLLPAGLVIAVRRRLKEPESWVQARDQAKAGIGEQMGSIRELFWDPRWRKNTIIGVVLALSGVVGVWGVGFYTPELLRDILDRPGEVGRADQELLATVLDRSGVIEPDELELVNAIVQGPGKVGPAERDLLLQIVRRAEPANSGDEEIVLTIIDRSGMVKPGDRERWVAVQSILQDCGAFFGILGFTWMATTFGRRIAFMGSYLIAFASIVLVFGFMNSITQMIFMIPILGFCTLSVFGGFAIYFPELFPTRLRTTGIGFCYNVARYLAAVGPLAFGQIIVTLTSLEFSEPFRLAAIIVAGVYFMGFAAVLMAPETKDKELPT